MSRHFSLLVLGASLCQWLLTPIQPAEAAASGPVTILLPREASWMEQLAAREARRYIYLRTGQKAPMVAATAGFQAKGEAILIARKDRAALKDLGADASLAAALEGLAPQGYCLKTLMPAPSRGAGSTLLLVVGGDDAGTLYGAYRLAERLGVRFYLHGDVIPDEREPWRMPVLDERAAPLFALRGIQPFHDFPEGPDWWNRDDYLAIIGQLPKLRMNFFGLHTYPEGGPCAEPTVWIGLPKDVGEGDNVKFSYPSSYQNSLRGNWGYSSTRTGDYLFGSAALFERDAFGPEVMGPCIPLPKTAEENNQVFERTAAMLRDAFGFARKLGVKTCAGTETPLIVPKLVRERIEAEGRNPADPAMTRELYEGIFRRVAQAYPLDYYWFWTPEDWTWTAVKEEQIAATMRDFEAAIAAYKKVGPPFGLATCGWVLGPQQDRAMFDRLLPKEVAVSCINRQVGYTPVDAGFAKVTGRSKWAIPWLEDDPALTSPQLWAGRMRRDAADALRYGCDGLMGIHWRTRVLSPNIAALALAAWDQSAWLDSKDFYEDWALHQFGPGAAAGAASIFQRMDGNLPKPSVWTDGPGGIKPDTRPWEQARKEYAFVEEFAGLRPQVEGAGNLERFDYWLSTFRYFRSIAEMNCAWAQYNRLFDRLKQEKDPAARKPLARQEALPARQRLVGLVGAIYEHLLATVSTPGELGTVANWNQHNVPGLLLKPGEELAAMLGEPLPAEAQPGRQYQGPMRIIVPTLRASLPATEALKLKVIILSTEPPREAALHWRKLGEGAFARIPLRHLERGVYSVELPPIGDDFEYYLQADLEGEHGPAVRFPATAPGLNQTVVVTPDEEPRRIQAAEAGTAQSSAPKAYPPTPTERQMRWHGMEFYGFLHFTVNTFTDKEWGDGDEDEKVFNPTAFDADQIVLTAKEAGMKGVILTAKHHDGFCLWPSRYTEHSVKNSPWRGGHGDVVKDISEACGRHGLKFGVYLSPWDRNHKDYGRPEYLSYYRNQLRELLTNYGDIFAVWFDGANGGSGYYGGARETRHIDASTFYDWENTRKLVRQLMPAAVMFSDAGPDVRWVGNEDGVAGDPCWATLNAAGRYPGGSSARLNSGERPGTDWIPPECDVSIRPGWFYHASEDARVKTPKKLLDIYYKSVGRSACLNLNIPPDRRGQIHEDDRQSLLGFRRILDATFATNLAQGAELSASNVRGGAREFAPENALAGNGRAYWATDDGVSTPDLVLDLRRPVTFNVVSLGEFLPLGQRIEAFALDQWKDGGWVEFAKGSSIGHRRLIRGAFITTDKVRLRITQCSVCPALASLGLFAEPE